MKVIPSLLGGVNGPCRGWTPETDTLGERERAKGEPWEGHGQGTPGRVHTWGVQGELQQLGPRECHRGRTHIAEVTNDNSFSSQNEFMLQTRRSPWGGEEQGALGNEGIVPLQKLGLWALAGRL